MLVESHQEGSAINGAIPSSFYMVDMFICEQCIKIEKLETKLFNTQCKKSFGKKFRGRGHQTDIIYETHIVTYRTNKHRDRA